MSRLKHLLQRCYQRMRMRMPECGKDTRALFLFAKEIFFHNQLVHPSVFRKILLCLFLSLFFLLSLPLLLHLLLLRVFQVTVNYNPPLCVFFHFHLLTHTAHLQINNHDECDVFILSFFLSFFFSFFFSFSSILNTNSSCCKNNQPTAINYHK